MIKQTSATSHVHVFLFDFYISHAIDIINRKSDL